MGAKKKTGEPTSAAFNVTKQEEVVKKEIHIVGQRVKYYREKKGIEQMALAEMLGVKSNAISNWEHGRTRPDLDQIPKICKALGIGFYELFGVDDPLRTFTAKEREYGKGRFGSGLSCFLQLLLLSWIQRDPTLRSCISGLYPV